MKKLEESDIIRIMREEWDAKVAALAEAVEVALTGHVDGEETVLISPGLKVWSKVTPPDAERAASANDSRGYLYTVHSVSPQGGVELKTPEGKIFPVSKDELEKSYMLNVGERKSSKSSNGDKK